MELGNHIAIKAPYLQGSVFGGPFRNFAKGTRRLVGVKMAAEIDHPHDIGIPTNDFSVPPVDSMQKGIMKALMAIQAGNDVYAGCMGGIGRTGLFMGCMVACVDAINAALAAKEAVHAQPMGDPVFYVRKHYLGHALETDAQRAYARGFDTSPVVKWYMEDVWLLHNPDPIVITKEVIREVPVYLSPWDWAMHTLFGAPKP